jgi:hypothetical protein
VCPAFKFFSANGAPTVNAHMNMQQEVLGFLRIDWHDVSPPRSEVGTKSVSLTKFAMVCGKSAHSNAYAVCFLYLRKKTEWERSELLGYSSSQLATCLSIASRSKAILVNQLDGMFNEYQSAKNRRRMCAGQKTLRPMAKVQDVRLGNENIE